MELPTAADASAFEQFRTTVLADPASQEALREIEEWRPFVAAAVEVARSLGYDVTPADLDQARARATTEWLERWI